MQSNEISVRRLAVPALLLAAAALSAAPGALSAAAPRAKPAAAAAAPKTAAEPAAASKDAAADAKPAPAPGGPPDGKWLKDKDGRQYYLDKLDKSAHFDRLDAHHVRTAWGITIDPVKEDAKYFYFKIYKVDGIATAPHSYTPSADEIKKMEATYQVDTPESHRLKLVPFSKGLPTEGQWRHGFDLADMNEDGHLDIVHSPPRKASGPPVIFLGDGKGSWRRWTEAKFPRLPYDYGDAAVGDFNGDGHMDIALGVHLRGLLAVTGDGKGNFQEAYKGLDFVLPGQGRQPGYSSRTIAIADWNHDGRPDIIAVGEGPRLNLIGRDARVSPNTESYGVVVYLSQPDGSWLRKDQGTSSREIFAESIALGDFNGDHRIDFATGSSVMGKKSLVNYSREDGGWNTVEVEPVRPRAYIASVDAVDLNGDGLDDLVVGYMSFENATWRSGIDVFYSHKDGTWTRRGLASLERRTQITAISHGDLDGDGKTDLVALTAIGETWVFLNDGKGWFSRETATGVPAYAGGCTGYHVRLADLDGDGKDEIVADFAGENSPANDPDSCPSGGGILAWHTAPAGPP